MGWNGIDTVDAPSGKRLHGYWKLPIYIGIVDLPIKNGDFP